MNKTRLEAFSDAVIAILMTIMVLELKVPHGVDLKALGENNLPSMALRVAMLKNNIPEKYFKQLNSPAPLYKNVLAMIKANYPALVKTKAAKINKLLRVVKGFRKGILADRVPEKMCFAVCLPLHSYLEFAGYKTRLTEGYLVIDGEQYQHFWLQYNDIIIDPTANQFKKPDGETMPEIYVGQMPEWYNILNENL